MADKDEEFEPLFDYTRIQPNNGVFCLDDDSLDESPIFCSKRLKISGAEIEKKEQDKNANDAKVINCDDTDDEDDWLPPPPKNSDDTHKMLEENSTLKALRLKRQELASFAQSADEVVRAVEESVRKDYNASLQYSPESAKKQPEPTHERPKLVISIQDKEETKQIRVFTDEKFERLFKMYADKNKLDVKNIVFCFDGDKISSTATPDSLGMEENDIIEVHVKSS